MFCVRYTEGSKRGLPILVILRGRLDSRNTLKFLGSLKVFFNFKGLFSHKFQFK